MGISFPFYTKAQKNVIKYFSEVRRMTKKKDIKGKNYTVNQLSIGKKVIGEILTMSEKNYEAFLGEEDLGAYKSLDLAVEAVLLQHNLHD